MKRFFTKTGIWLLAAAATIAVALCVVSALGSGTGFLHNALGVVASPFRAAGAAVAGWFTDLGDRFESVEQLQEKNAELNRAWRSWRTSCGRPRTPPTRIRSCASCWVCASSAPTCNSRPPA